MPKKKNALEKARSSLKKAEGAYTIRSIKNKLKKPLKVNDQVQTRRKAKKT